LAVAAKSSATSSATQAAALMRTRFRLFAPLRWTVISRSVSSSFVQAMVEILKLVRIFDTKKAGQLSLSRPWVLVISPF
jgi:hypothetical protein